MNQILQHAATISLMITAIYYSMQNGEIFGDLAAALDDIVDAMAKRLNHPGLWNITKPLYRCNICMGGIWTLVLYPAMWGWEWAIIPTAITTIGMNVIMATIIKHLEQ